jgi:Asp-tRNA(Asn)/Glu-tRNA(Gln) amidotransferase A subunit family amidase
MILVWRMRKRGQHTITAVREASEHGVPTTIRSASVALQERAVRSRDLVEACLSRIDELNGRLNAFITVDADGARRAADRADVELDNGRHRGPLHGVPVSLKDLLDQEGLPTTAGSRSMHVVAARDAEAVAHLRAAGAVFVGKCNMHEFAMGTTTDDSGYGPAHHPLDDTRVPGGSSGGSAIAVATGMSLGSIGSDTGGSIRIPASACGLVGLKPAWNEVSLDGVVPLSPTLDCVGPLARTVEDAWLLLDGLTGQRRPLPDVPAIGGGARARVPRHLFASGIDPGILQAFDAALARLGRAGLASDEVTLTTAAGFVPTYVAIVMTEALAYHTPRMAAHAHEYTPRVRARLDGVAPPAVDEYERALADRAAIEREVAGLVGAGDILVLPALAIEPPPIGAETTRVGSDELAVRPTMLRLTQPFNMSRHAALTIPCGTTAAGFPVGFQIVARSSSDVVAWGRAIEGVLASASR